MQRTNRLLGLLGCFALAWVALALPAPASLDAQRDRGPERGQDADEAAATEDELDALLRRFGEDAEGLKEEIDEAVDNGVQWLAEQQNRDGSWDNYPSLYAMGGTALCALALKKSIIGMYEGTERELQRDIRRLERLQERDRATPEQLGRLRYLQRRGEQDIEIRRDIQQRVDRAIEWIRSRYNRIKNDPPVTYSTGGEGPNFKVYDIGVILMLLEGQYTRRIEERGQSRVGVEPRDVDRQDLAWIREMVNWLEGRLIQPQQDGQSWDGRGWRYPGAAQDGATVDMSNTQYAILGLKAASRMGVRIRNEDVWRDLVTYTMELQCEDGPEVRRRFMTESTEGLRTAPVHPEGGVITDRARGWSYLPIRSRSYPATGAMTTAALAVLLMGLSELHELNVLPNDDDLNERLNQSINDGLAWLGHHYSVRTNPTDSRRTYGWHYYYLYGLERAGVLAQTEFMGEHPWYLDGARLLLRQQSRDGSWEAGTNPAQDGDETGSLTDTSFAILFLKRATVPLRVNMGPVITGGDRDE